MKRKVALFDFDNTIANGDTITRLVIYDLKKKPYHVIYFVCVAIYYLGYMLKFNSFEKAKSYLLFPLRSMSEKECQKFYKEYVEPYYYSNVVEELKQKKEDGYFVIVCTASTEKYMKYCELPIDAMLGTIYENKKIIGKNCKNEEKIPRILSCLKENGIEDIDYENSYGYSDSNADIPMLSLVKNKKRVSLKTGAIVDFKE